MSVKPSIKLKTMITGERMKDFHGRKRTKQSAFADVSGRTTDAAVADGEKRLELVHSSC